MKQPLYIHAVASLSPQATFGIDILPENLFSSADGQLYVQPADYSKYINPVAIRRMGRLLKMAIATAMEAVQQAGWTTPDAIITGTGRGSMTDMQQFLGDMITYKETALNPTHFIQSTYNSPNGWIALQTKSNGYNQTYVHRGLSLELALLDAMLLAEKKEQQNALQLLVGSYDELTADYYKVKSKIGYWKKESLESIDLLQSSTEGTVGGEGATFLALSNYPKSTGKNIRLEALKTIHQANEKSLLAGIDEVLNEIGWKLADVDAVLVGKNGAANTTAMYDSAIANFPESTTVLGFKQLCGEYDTASGFALWLAHGILKTGAIPKAVVLREGATAGLQRVLIINTYLMGSGSVMAMSVEN